MSYHVRAIRTFKRIRGALETDQNKRAQSTEHGDPMGEPMMAKSYSASRKHESVLPKMRNALEVNHQVHED